MPYRYPPEFRRKVLDLGLGPPGWEIHRYGTELDPRPGATKPARFVERVEPGGEPWEEGMFVMHNPNAKFPLPVSAFSGVNQISQVSGHLSVDLVGRQIFNQFTMLHRVSHRAEALKLIH